MAFHLRDRWNDLRRQWRLVRRESPRLVASVEVIMVAAIVLSIVGSVVCVVSAFRGLPDLDAVRHIGNMDEATTVYDEHDQFAFTIFQEQRIQVPLSGISPNLTRAIVAIEDQRFFDHRGFDAARIASAAWANVRHGRVAQGGSTITQQLARQSLLSPDKTYRRKFQELVLAQRIEHVFTKSQILELYLNK